MYLYVTIYLFLVPSQVYQSKAKHLKSWLGLFWEQNWSRSMSSTAQANQMPINIQTFGFDITAIIWKLTVLLWCGKNSHLPSYHASAWRAHLHNLPTLFPVLRRADADFLYPPIVWNAGSRGADPGDSKTQPLKGNSRGSFLHPIMCHDLDYRQNMKHAAPPSHTSMLSL